MRMPKAFTKEVLIRLEGTDGLVSTVRYGWLCSISEAFHLSEHPYTYRPETASWEPSDVVPMIVPLKKRPLS